MTDSATFTTPEADEEDLGEDLGDLLLEVLSPEGKGQGLPAKSKNQQNEEADQTVILCKQRNQAIYQLPKG